MTRKRNLSNHDVSQILLHYRETDLHTKENEEHHSEQRINFFIGLLTAVLALLCFIYKENYFPDHQDIISIVSLLILASYGILTFSKIIWRNRLIDKWDKAIGGFNESIKALDPYIKEQLEEIGKKREEPSFFIFRILKGTLAQFMYLTEGLLVSGIALVIGIKYDFPDFIKWALPVIVFLVVVFLMFKWSQYIRK